MVLSFFPKYHRSVHLQNTHLQYADRFLTFILYGSCLRLLDFVDEWFFTHVAPCLLFSNQALNTLTGSVTLQRIGFFCFPIKHSTHTLKRIGFFCFPIKHSTHTPERELVYFVFQLNTEHTLAQHTELAYVHTLAPQDTRKTENHPTRMPVRLLLRR